MEMIALLMQHKSLMRLLGISLLLIGLHPAVAFSSTQDLSQTSSQAAISTAAYQINKATKPANNTAQQRHASAKTKSILIKHSRGLSAFLIGGIALNILMAASFAWWFSKEWRRSRK